MNKLYAIGLSMILLILSMPAVFALQIQGVSIQGADGFDDYVRSDEPVNIVATIDENVTADRVQIRFLDVPFDDCIAKGSVYECSLNQDFGTTYNRITPSIGLYDITKTILVDEFRAEYFVDNTVPEVLDIVAVQNGQQVDVTYSVVDTAYQGSGPNICVGLSEIRVSAGGGVKASTTVDGCAASGMLSFPLSSLGQGNTFSVCVEAIDRFGQESTGFDCKDVTLDRQPPIVAGLDLVDDDEPVRFIGNSQSGSVVFNVVDNNFVETVDLSINDQPVPVSCALQGSVTQCTTSSFAVDAQSYTLRVEVSDTAGNIADTTTTINVQRDQTAPLLTSIATDVEYLGNQYVSTTTPIYAIIDETESGFSDNRVRLALPGGSTVSGTCEPGWTCTFFARNLNNEGEQTFTLVNSFDDAGNAVFGEGTTGLDRELIVDVTAPALEVNRVYSFFDTNSFDIVYDNAPAFVDVFVEDLLPVNVEVDFSEIGGGVDAQVCEDNCTLQSATLPSGVSSGSIYITATDLVGNVEQEVIDVVVLAQKEEANQWSHTAPKLSPPTIDRSVAQLINQRVYVSFDLVADRAEILDVTLDSCRSTDVNETSNGGFVDEQGQAVSSYAYVRDVELMDFGPVSNEQFLLFEFKAISFEGVNQLDITCDLIIASSRGDFFYPEEIQSIPVTFGFFNNPAGDLGESYEEELQAAIDDANDGILNKIASLRDFVEVAMQICNILLPIVSLITAVDQLFLILGITSDGLLSSIYAAPAGVETKLLDGQICFVSAAGYETLNTILDYASLFCNLVTCKLSLTGLLLGELDLLGDTGQAIVETKNAIADNLGAKFGRAATGQGGTVDTPIGESNTDEGSFLDTANSYVDDFSYTEDSLFWSVANLCLPGIIKNLDEYRQVKCRYAVCLQDDVPNGVPKQACDTAKEYQMCKYITGEIFAAIPFVVFFDQVMNMIKQLLSNPIFLIGAAIGVSCAATCPASSVPVWLSWAPVEVCNVYKALNVFSKIIFAVESLASAGDYELGGEADACADIDTD